MLWRWLTATEGGGGRRRAGRGLRRSAKVAKTSGRCGGAREVGVALVVLGDGEDDRDDGDSALVSCNSGEGRTSSGMIP